MTHLEFATDLARQAGAIIKQNFQLGMKKNWKGDGTPVTETDHRINQLVLDAVARVFPDHAVISEEGSRPLAGAPFSWVCDPVDGTIPFSHGQPTFVFALALVDTATGQPVLGVLYDPILDRLTSAERDHGATLNGQPIHVSDKTGLTDRTMVGFGTWSTAPYQIADTYSALIDRGLILTNPGSILYMSLLVAIGEFDGAVFPGDCPWDAAAARVIVAEAGGRVTDLYGQEQRYDEPTRGMIASNGHVHDELVAIVGQHLKPA